MKPAPAWLSPKAKRFSSLSQRYRWCESPPLTVGVPLQAQRNLTKPRPWRGHATLSLRQVTSLFKLLIKQKLISDRKSVTIRILNHTIGSR